LGYAELLDSGDIGELKPEQKEPMGVIVRRCRMLRKLVEDLTAILEAEAGRMKLEPVDLAELVKTLQTDFHIAAQKARLALTIDIEPGAHLVPGDAANLRRILDNLVGNAFKFTPEGGAVHVRVSSHSLPGGAAVTLEVADTGIGIPPDKLERIFDRFYQVDGSARRRYGGVGLGLALVKEIAQAHHGDVSVQSAVGHGSTFRVVLPGLKAAGE
jgi:signal transduction histidine kinase